MRSAHRQPRPLVVIGGFLGAGKTTLVNHVLNNPEGRRIAVIVNDIGKVNIDNDLIQNAEQDRIALTNGCICCSLQSDLLNAVTQIVNQEQGIDAIVVEASGVSDPVSLLSSVHMLGNAGIVREDALVYIVDASTFDQLDFDAAERVLDHAALSDLVIINKRDIATKDQYTDLLAHLNTVAPTVATQTTAYSHIPVPLLFAPGATNLASRHPGNDLWLSDNHHGYTEHTVRSECALDKQRFDVFASEISRFCWRAKGFVRFTQAPETMHLFNLVGRRATLEPLDEEMDIGGRSTTRIVVIGRSESLLTAPIDRAFNDCLC